ncbi:MAG: hypothetical protein JSR24_04145, partial [Proteobacteria bacterium]|nr:hypothetical protein [Pseudomonadota bacterium]
MDVAAGSARQVGDGHRGMGWHERAYASKQSDIPKSEDVATIDHTRVSGKEKLVSEGLSISPSSPHRSARRAAAQGEARHQRERAA